MDGQPLTSPPTEALLCECGTCPTDLLALRHQMMTGWEGLWVRSVLPFYTSSSMQGISFCSHQGCYMPCGTVFFFFLKKPYYDPTCKRFEWWELKDAKKFLPQILNPHLTVEMPAWQQTLWTWWNSASVWHYFISCLLFKISVFKILHGNTLLWFRHLKDVKVWSDIRMIKRYLPPHPCPPNSLTPWVPLY